MKPAKVKLLLWESLPSYDCPICSIEMGFWDCDIDHIIPRCRGGKDDNSNLQLVHKRCNRIKGAHLPKGYDEKDYPILRRGKPVVRIKSMKEISLGCYTNPLLAKTALSLAAQEKARLIRLQAIWKQIRPVET